MKIGDKIYVRYGNDFYKAKIVAENDGNFLCNLNVWNIKINLSDRDYYLRKSFLDKLLNK